MGVCQFCGAKFLSGIHECVEDYSNGLQLLDFSNSEHYLSRFYSVDAHALQHPEIHDRWNNHFYLTILYLIFEKNEVWDYVRSSPLCVYLKNYKTKNATEIIIPPSAKRRVGVNFI